MQQREAMHKHITHTLSTAPKNNKLGMYHEILGFRGPARAPEPWISHIMSLSDNCYFGIIPRMFEVHQREALHKHVTHTLSTTPKNTKLGMFHKFIGIVGLAESQEAYVA